MKINNKKAQSSASKEQLQHGHLNHMGGVSYDIKNPIMQLRIVSSSCFFGEPMYYHDYEAKTKDVSNKRAVPFRHAKYLDSVLQPALSYPNHHSLSPSALIETAIDTALAFDPEATLKEAVRLRNEENMRTTPQVIMVRAANHQSVRGTGLIKQYAQEIMLRTDEAAVQLAYQIQVFGRPIPNALKKAWKAFLETRSEYDLAKYRMESRQFKLVDVINMVHAYSPSINLLVKGELKLSEAETWESIVSAKGSNKQSWEKAIDVMGHMALLRNLCNFHKNEVDPELYLGKLIETAKTGKQLPFRYYSAYRKLKEEAVSGKILDAVEECMELALGELPQFKGKTMSLCDNSGSAQNATTSQMGTMTAAAIANLTAVITGKISEDGYIGVFGDKLEVSSIRKKASIFDQVNAAGKAAIDIGASTENGIWLFFDNAIRNKEHWDNIFVYSDMQAGHGELYGCAPGDYANYNWNNTHYIDVAKLISTYRKQVNPDVKVYLVQIAGQQDTLVPEFYDKTYILGGWGDGLLRFAHEMSQCNQSNSN